MIHHQANIHIMEVPEREERKKIEKLIQRNSHWKLPKSGNEMDIQIQEAQKIPNKMNRDTL